MALKRTFEELPLAQRNIVAAIVGWVVPPCEFTALLYLEDDGWIEVCDTAPGWKLTPEGLAAYSAWLDADIARAQDDDLPTLHQLDEAGYDLDDF